MSSNDPLYDEHQKLMAEWNEQWPKQCRMVNLIWRGADAEKLLAKAEELDRELDANRQRRSAILRHRFGS